MTAMAFTSKWKQAAGAILAVGTLTLTVACNGTANGTRNAATGNVDPPAQQLSPSQAGTPVVVSCEPHQRTLVRPAVVNGTAVSQVECVAGAQVTTPHAVAYAPVAPEPVYAPAPASAPVRRVSQPVYGDLGDAQVVPVSNRAPRAVRTNQVVYDERPVKKTRSVAKSAVIIGSSAGAGAGVGAAIGGKKGALIGAAIGGGGAAVWDQVTRRK